MRVTRITSVTPDFNTKPEQFIQFLADTFSANPELIGYMQRLVWYSIFGRVTRHILPFLHGLGANGKTVLLEIFLSVLGDYGTVQPADFLLSHGDEHETIIARLSGQRLVVCSEVSPTAKFNEQRVKDLTGGGRITARFMRQDHFTFMPTHTLWLVGNHEPQVEVGGNSMWRRLRKIPFNHAVPEEKQIEDLSGILVRKEGPAILAWMIQGAQMQVNGLNEPRIVTMATQEYRESEDQVGRFLAERTYRTEGDLYRMESKILRQAYEQWCADVGEKPINGPKQWGQELKAHGIVGIRGSKGRTFYADITVLNSENDNRPEQQEWYDK
jgi:putative DNA primase/helicase